MPQEPQSFATRLVREVTLRYLLYLPPDYDPEGEPQPLVLFLHGAGERGDDLEMVKKHGPPKLVEAGREFPFILVSPQCPEGEAWSPEALGALVDHLEAEHNIDPTRIYLTGLSMGGAGIWALAGHQPKRFAALAPICAPSVFMAASRLRDVPSWVFHGAKDPVVPLSQSEVMVERMERAGADTRLTVYPEAEHDSWTETYANDELYDWLLSHHRPNARA